MSKLVIVKSPAKAKTIASVLGAGYVVRALLGHVRALNYADAQQLAQAALKFRTAAEVRADIKL